MLARHITQTKETCDHLIDGSINPRALGMSSAEDLQSENMRKQNEDYIKHSVYWATRKMEAIESSSFKCGKCRKNQCMYTQAQTRSADEPMTTFVFCVNCGHRWKF
ncbi:MAG: putative transcription elongation factor S-II [Streblomastix strix]|uniref:Putative transcription elongation factor S-II n=1 Tax=Streblomastix strix TaxID=222440 RepID=A0A5J4QRN2_9EUKA|nr:MAG: putative transcription elongation factor S-II [Streblomastix strix]